jgi:glycyl-tRNA synthetase
MEIGTEELPAADIDVAVTAVRRGIGDGLAQTRLQHGTVRVCGTPRRLTLIVDHLASSQAEVIEIVRGPAWDAAFNADGQPTRAAAGFAKRNRVEPGDLFRVEHEHRAYAAARLVNPARSAIEVLRELLPDLVRSISFRRSMRWNESGTTYSRPIRWVVALLGKQVIPFELAGITAGRTTRGLRVAEVPIELNAAGDYEGSMQSAGIMLDNVSRREAIWHAVTDLAAEVGGRPPSSASDSLLAEVANLVEFPTAIRGSFDEGFLDLPPEVLQTVMIKHQRFFPILRGNAVAPMFIGVANGVVDENLVRAGNEAVIRARYSDAKFFYEHDQCKPLAAYRQDLGTLTVHEKLGSMLDKAHRVEELTGDLAAELGLTAADAEVAKRVAHLAKNDLVTELVIEFPDLAGIMGGYYAQQSGESLAVAAGIRDHVRPVDASDHAPDQLAGGVVGLADRLDSLVGLFAAGVGVRSTSDPYGLRRAGHGIISIIIALDLDLDLDLAVRSAILLLPDELADADVKADVLAFIWRRLETWMRERGLAPDIVTAAIEGARPSIVYKYRVAGELSAIKDSNEFLDVLTAYTRAERMTRGVSNTAASVNPNLFESEYEWALHKALQQVRKTPGLHDSVRDFVRGFSVLIAPVNELFDNVFVTGEDGHAANRLALLRLVADLARPLANLDALHIPTATVSKNSGLSRYPR